jgi:Zn-finger domain-containing protein
MRSEFAKHDLFPDLCCDVKCIKFYIRYFKKIIQERDLLLTQLSKNVTAHSITTGLHTNHITGNCAFKKLANLKLNK